VTEGAAVTVSKDLEW